MTVSRVWNRWAKDGNTERCTGFQWPPITSSREDRHANRMALIDCAATSGTLSQELGSFVKQQVSARTVGRRLQQHGYTARRPGLRLPLHQDGRIRVRRHRDERPLAVCISHCHTGPLPVLMQDNARLDVAGIVWTAFDTESVRLLTWPSRSPDLSPIENVWFMTVKRLARHHTPFPTVDELWHRVEAAWTSVPVPAI
ncbi:transposable element Tcb1 transposase [Trichonephila clavipes]|nr:transposable element Tcb1 transposase [Trichonephila clavipes]